MQPPHPQQVYQSTPSHNSGSGYPSHPGVTDFMMPGLSQRVAPSYNAQHFTTQDIYRVPVAPTGPGYGDDVYGGRPIPGYGSYRAMAPRSWGTSAPQTLQNYDYPVPNIPFGNPRQGAPYYYVGYPFSTEQIPAPTMGYSHYLPADPSQDAASEWRFHTRCFNHAEGGETHLTYGNEAYGGSVSGYGSDATPVAGSWGTLTPQPLQNYDYSMYRPVKPNTPYSNPGQGESHFAGHRFSTEQVAGPSVPHFPEADPNQDTSSEGRLRTCCQPYGDGGR